MCMSVCNIDCVCIIFCYNVICVNNNVCGSLCVQYKNNTYVANEKVTWHLSFYYKYFIKTVATFTCPDIIGFYLFS